MYADVMKAARATGALDRARRLVAELRSRAAAIERRVRGRPRPRVFCMEWIDPVFTTGHWVPEMVRRAGGVEGLATAGKDSRRIEWTQVVRYAPERLIIMPCGLSMERAIRDARVLPSRPGWREIPAVRDGHVWVADGPSYFNGSGPRLVDGLEILAAIIHPGVVRKNRGVHKIS
jgi:iron complex transport system substrate-binding protein